MQVARLATAQHGVVTRAQLEAAGIGRGAIAHRVKAGQLHRLHRGVYALGHTALPALAREQAALLACGPEAVLSHATAAALWNIWSPPDDVHITVPRRTTRRHQGVTIHRPLELSATDVRTRNDLPLTAPARTILDLAPHLSAIDTERLVAEAQVQRLVPKNDPRLQALLGDDQPRLTRSEAERRLLQLIDRAHLPRPRTNHRVAGYEVDAVWPDKRLAVEVDGFAFHRTRWAFERDRRKDLALRRAGYATIRLSWRQIDQEPEAVVAAIASACT